MALTTIEVEVTSGTLSENINAAYAANSVTSSNFKSLMVIDDAGTKRILITYDHAGAS